MTAHELGNVRVRSGSRERQIGYFRKKWAWLIPRRVFSNVVCVGLPAGPPSIAMAVRIEEGMIVRTKDGLDGVVLSPVETVFGFRLFDVMLFDTAETKRFTRLQIDPVGEIIDADFGEVELLDLDEPAAPIDNVENKPAQCFATIENDEQIEELASCRLSKSTERQTRWAVRVFRGRFC